jgi:hypothetical protein
MAGKIARIGLLADNDAAIRRRDLAKAPRLANEGGALVP